MKSKVKAPGSTREQLSKPVHLKVEEGSGIPSVVVECVDIRKNTRGEGDFLVRS